MISHDLYHFAIVQYCSNAPELSSNPELNQRLGHFPDRGSIKAPLPALGSSCGKTSSTGSRNLHPHHSAPLGFWQHPCHPNTFKMAA
jgi:hypothetical protein